MSKEAKRQEAKSQTRTDFLSIGDFQTATEIASRLTEHGFGTHIVEEMPLDQNLGESNLIGVKVVLPMGGADPFYEILLRVQSQQYFIKDVSDNEKRRAISEMIGVEIERLKEERFVRKPTPFKYR